MKKVFVSGFTVILLAGFCFTDDNPLVGKWELKQVFRGETISLGAIFRANGTFDGSVNKKLFVSGIYRVIRDTVYFSDALCNSQYEGMYRLNFFGERDSVKFEVIQDTCTKRREGTDGFVFKRIKKN